jgi:hypothetical protein
MAGKKSRCSKGSMLARGRRLQRSRRRNGGGERMIRFQSDLLFKGGGNKGACNGS